MSYRVDQQIGNYRLIRQLGTGGYAEVYLGQHLHLDTVAAVKVLHQPLRDEHVKKFHDEACTIASLLHPHIIHILDFGIDTQANIPYLVMDYAPNGSMCQRHPRGVPLPLELIVRYVKQLADSLQYAHSQRYPDNKRLIHRDVKPENILFGRNDELLLSDFGIAVITQTTDPRSPQELAGTLAYMAPEQIQGKPRRASDQYALGIVVYEWLCGTCPFSGSRTSLAYQHLNDPPPSLRLRVPSLSPSVEQVVLKALEKNPKERFASVQEFAIALEQAALSSKLTGEHSFSESSVYTYRGHAAAVKALAWSPDGERIASGGDERTIQMWDATTGCNVFAFPGHRGVVNTLAWSPDGKRIASGGQDGTVQLWDAITGKHIFTYTGHASSVTATAWSPNGQYVASVSQDRTVQVWNAFNRKTYDGHTSDVVAVAWSPDSAWIASGSLDGTVLVWDVATGSSIRSYHHVDPVNALAWSSDGQRIASAGDGKKVRVRELTTGRIVVTYRRHTHAIHALAWSSDGQYIASAGSDRTVQLWSATTGSHKFTYRGHADAVHAVAWNPVWGSEMPGGRRLASASADHTVQVWQML